MHVTMWLPLCKYLSTVVNIHCFFNNVGKTFLQLVAVIGEALVIGGWALIPGRVLIQRYVALNAETNKFN